MNRVEQQAPRRRRTGLVGRRRGQRGAAALEFALIAPVLFAMLFGIIEMAFLMRDYVSLTSLVRAGGRTASASVPAGVAGVAEGGDCISPCTPSNAPMLAQLAANSIQRAGTGLPPDSIKELWIYKANDKGYPGVNGSTSMTCGSNCVKYAWVPAKDQFRYLSGSWSWQSINACANSNPDSVGVYIKASHRWLSGMFGSAVTIEDHAVFTVEPMPTLTCAPNTHV